MDAFGASAAALQFGVALFRAAQTLDAALNGKSSEPVVTIKALGQIAEGECDAFLGRFPDDNTPTVRDARIIARQGKDICRALLRKIAKMHPDKKSPKTVALALGAIMWSKDELAELQRSLGDCMQALGRFLSQQDRVMVETALRNSENALASRIDAKSDEILAQYIETSAQSDGRWSQLIQLANTESAKRSAQKKVKLLLDALTFPGMGQRYIEVSTADKSTFHWILEGQENASVDDRFARWLTSGNGVFHIAGKPGSGKSTLMKYVFENPTTTQMLEQWAAGKTLVQAACFFWKPGDVLQRTMMGLVRTLLHGMIVASHDVAKTLFPEVWDAAGIEEKSKISLSDAAIQEAFQRLVDGDARLAGAGNCYCFFIDGLDEYGEANNTIIELVRQLTHMAQNGIGWLKICASSREYPQIIEKLAADEAHRLALQDVTRGDMIALVGQRLQKAFPDDDVLKNNDLLKLQNVIIERAEGVFLWVVLVLGMIEEEADLGTPVRELQKFVQAQNNNLDTFFESIVARIEKRNLQKVAILFQYTLLEAKLSSRRRHFVSSYGLIWYMYLLEHPAVDNSGHEDAVLARYKRVQSRLQTRDAVEAHLHGVEKQIKQYCEGLLTVHSKNVWQAKVLLTHRSIHEFLSNLLATRWKDAVSNFDAAGAYVRMLLSFPTTVLPHQVEFFAEQYFELQIAVGPDGLGTSQVHRNFQLIEAFGVLHDKRSDTIPIVVAAAAGQLCHEYLYWRRHRPHTQQVLVGKQWTDTLNSIVASGHDMRQSPVGDYSDLPKTVEVLLASGVSVSGIEEYQDVDDTVIHTSPWTKVWEVLYNDVWLGILRRPDAGRHVRGLYDMIELFIQASDGADGVLPTWVWLDEHTVLLVVDGHIVSPDNERDACRLVKRMDRAALGYIPMPASKAMPGTVSLAEVLAALDLPAELVALAEAREPAAARARRAEELLSEESLVQLEDFSVRVVSWPGLARKDKTTDIFLL